MADPKDYRPISLLPLVSETIEKSIHFQIVDYLNKKNLINMYSQDSEQTTQQTCV